MCCLSFSLTWAGGGHWKMPAGWVASPEGFKWPLPSLGIYLGKASWQGWVKVGNRGLSTVYLPRGPWSMHHTSLTSGSIACPTGSKAEQAGAAQHT